MRRRALLCACNLTFSHTHTHTHSDGIGHSRDPRCRRRTHSRDRKCTHAGILERLFASIEGPPRCEAHRRSPPAHARGTWRPRKRRRSKGRGRGEPLPLCLMVQTGGASLAEQLAQQAARAGRRRPGLLLGYPEHWRARRQTRGWRCRLRQAGVAHARQQSRAGCERGRRAGPHLVFAGAAVAVPCRGTLCRCLRARCLRGGAKAAGWARGRRARHACGRCSRRRCGFLQAGEGAHAQQRCATAQPSAAGTAPPAGRPSAP